MKLHLSDATFKLVNWKNYVIFALYKINKYNVHPIFWEVEESSANPLQKIMVGCLCHASYATYELIR